LITAWYVFSFEMLNLDLARSTSQSLGRRNPVKMLHFPHSVLFAIFVTLLAACSAPVSGQAPNADIGWPRVHEVENGKIIVYQPQVDSWQDYTHLQARMAIQVIPKGKSEGVYGAVQLEMDTETNFQTRLVLLKNVQIKDLRFPGIPDDQAEAARQIYTGFIAQQSTMTISLDRIIAAMELSEVQKKTVDVNLAPPDIFYSDKPAILVIFIGEPKFETAVEGLLFAANTNWDLFLDPTQGAYFLRNDESWLTTKDLLKGPWSPADKLPEALSKLPDNENWQDVKQNLPGVPVKAAPAVYTSEKPAELIVTQGRPTYKTISGTTLLYVDNSESDLFLNPAEGKHYFSVAGRWFRSQDLWGPWQEASKDLPEEFKKIPETSPKATVLASVPGAPEADAAVLLASIPEKASVNRKEATLEVVYEGEPKFEPIQTTQVSYAVNTPDSVFLVNGAYYCCRGGVWFVAPSPKGPWAVCDSVPKEIYSIPASHPTHNVTYVYVYDSNPETVTVGYTSGYSGAYVAATGVLMFGLGYWLADELHDDHWHDYCYHYGPAYWGYGCGARYNYYNGGYVRAASYYGPYGGAGRAAAYNPATGTYQRAAYAYGPNGSAYARGAYNPYTGGYAGHAEVNTPYGSWGRTVVGQGDQWAQAGHRSNAAGSVGGIRTSEGTGIVARNNKITGESGAIAKNKYGDVYVGHDGNVYKRDSSGDWSKYDGQNGWTNPEPKSGDRAAARESAGNRESVSAADRQAARADSGTGARVTDRQATTGAATNRAQQLDRSQLDRSQLDRSQLDRSQLDRSQINRAQGSGQLGAANRPSTNDLTRQTADRAKPSQMPSSPGIEQLNRDFQSRQRGDRQASNFAKSTSGGGGRSFDSAPRGGGSRSGASRGGGGRSGGGGGRGGGGGGRGGGRR
jgi:hypothetical protein